MKRWLLIVLILLMPLRAWAVSGMSHQGVPGLPVVGVEALAEQGDSSDQTVHAMPDCHAAMQAAEQNPAPSPATLGCQCLVCQLCLPMAAWALPTLSGLTPLPLSHVHAHWVNAAFSNAYTDRLLRPPSA